MAAIIRTAHVATAKEVYPFPATTLKALSLIPWSISARSIWPWSANLVTASPSILTVDQAVNCELPCSPNTNPLTFLGSSPKCLPTARCIRAVSKKVPVPKTRSRGNPVACCKAFTITSHGLAIFNKIPLKPLALICLPTNAAFFLLIGSSAKRSPVRAVAPISPKAVTIISASASSA